MRLFSLHTLLASLWLIAAVCSATTSSTAATSTAGIEALVKRRLPHIHDKFTFSLKKAAASSGNSSEYDAYTVSNGCKPGTIHVSGNTQIALATGLRWYLVNVLKADMYWFIGSRLESASTSPDSTASQESLAGRAIRRDTGLPRLQAPQRGSSIVPWRYHLNTVTFSYTAAFWDWSDWEQQLDWMALHGINLPLAWIGYESILLDTLQEAGFNETDVINFMSGPAFQAWNRFGNIQASWGGSLPRSWIDGQFALGKQVIARMVELGMTPVLPAFTGFVPPSIADIYPNASFIKANAWSSFTDENTKDTFLETLDPLFTKIQKSFITKQQEAFGNVTHVYTLDQFNEMKPLSGELDYLKKTSNATLQSLKNANPDAIWMMQGWSFYYQSDFWTNERLEAFMGGVKDSDMIVLDLFSESFPQWQRTQSYFGKPWIWCMLHGYGGVIGMYGQVENITVNPIEAVSASSSMVGIGATMEGQEGNEIMYDIIFDQAWSKTPIDSKDYFTRWVAARYTSSSVPKLPQSLYTAWDGLRRTVYNNTDLDSASAVPASIYTKYPVLKGMVDNKGPFGTSITYDQTILQDIWSQFFQAGAQQPRLWTDSAFTFDLTDVTRQVLSNRFNHLYREFVAAVQKPDNKTATQTGHSMLSVLADLDSVLAAGGNAHFSLGSWIAAARDWASGQNSSAIADYYEYNARNQVTLWGPTGEINDYAGKEWCGLIETYYIPRWRYFINGYLSGESASDIQQKIVSFELKWQTPGSTSTDNTAATGDAKQLQKTISRIVKNQPSIFKV